MPNSRSVSESELTSIAVRMPASGCAFRSNMPGGGVVSTAGCAFPVSQRTERFGYRLRRLRGDGHAVRRWRLLARLLFFLPGCNAHSPKASMQARAQQIVLESFTPSPPRVTANRPTLLPAVHGFRTARATKNMITASLLPLRNMIMPSEETKAWSPIPGRSCKSPSLPSPFAFRRICASAVFWSTWLTEKLKTGCCRFAVFVLTLEGFEHPSGKLLQHLLCLLVGAAGGCHGSGMFGHHVGLCSFSDVVTAIVVSLSAVVSTPIALLTSSLLRKRQTFHRVIRRTRTIAIVKTRSPNASGFLMNLLTDSVYGVINPSRQRVPRRRKRR